MQCFNPVTASSTEKEKGIAVRIHFVSIPDNCHQSIYALPHVRVACDQVKFCHTGQVA